MSSFPGPGGPPPFGITSDRAAKLMRITYNGNWTVETVEQLRQETRNEVVRLAAAGCLPHELLILIDRRNQGPLSQEVVEATRTLSTENSGRAKRVALIVSGVLNKMQIKRINVAGTTQVFEDEDAALEWLTTGREPALG